MGRKWARLCLHFWGNSPARARFRKRSQRTVVRLPEKKRFRTDPFRSLSVGCYSWRVPQRRNLGGPRREASERVCLRPMAAGADIFAWTLNVSRGGLRLIVEDAVAVGAAYLVSIGDEPARPATVVWTREEADGQIAGMKFDDLEGGDVPSSNPPAP